MIDGKLKEGVQLSTAVVVGQLAVNESKVVTTGHHLIFVVQCFFFTGARRFCLCWENFGFVSTDQWPSHPLARANGSVSKPSFPWRCLFKHRDRVVVMFEVTSLRTLFCVWKIGVRVPRQSQAET